MKIKNIFSLLVLLCGGTVFAGGVERMHVQISNETEAYCLLTNQTLLHGTYDSAPPQAIMPGDSKLFDMEQTAFYGPEVILSYGCGDDFITFDLQQNLSVLTGTVPKAKILDSKNLTLAIFTQSSSYFYDSPGIINISIRDAKTIITGRR